MLKRIFVGMLSGFILIATPVMAEVHANQSPGGKAQILMDKLKADKKYITHKNLELTETEAKVFWPVYDEYQAELEKVNSRIAKLILTYAEAYNNKTMTDELALKLLQESFAIDAEELSLKKSLIPALKEVLPGKKATRYIQIESKLRALLRVKLADEIPLVE